MTLSFKGFFLSHPTNIIVVSLLVAALVIVAGFIWPHAKGATTLQSYVIEPVRLCHAIFIWGTSISGIIFLLRRKFFASSCYIVAATLAYTSGYAAAALKGDRLIFPGGAHREIASIYSQRASEFGLSDPNPHLVALGDECHPPNGCACWILIDLNNMSGAEADLGGWHIPKAAIFPANTLPVHFAIVTVRRLDSKAYSVLGCSMDWRPLIPS